MLDESIGNIDLGNPVQIGMVVRDARRTADLLTSLLGIGPFRFIDWPLDRIQDSFYRGKPCKWRMTLAFANYDNIEIELIEPVEGENGYTEYLNNVGEGLHHLLFEVDDIDDVFSKFSLRGIGTIMGGSGLRPGTRFVYLDTISMLGWSIELRNKVKNSDGKTPYPDNTDI
jgi:methylmalonyl-CoA/ethylmalonyl-CoA epimerase